MGKKHILRTRNFVNLQLHHETKPWCLSWHPEQLDSSLPSRQPGGGGNYRWDFFFFWHLFGDKIGAFLFFSGVLFVQKDGWNLVMRNLLLFFWFGDLVKSRFILIIDLFHMYCNSCWCINSIHIATTLTGSKWVIWKVMGCVVCKLYHPQVAIFMKYIAKQVKHLKTTSSRYDPIYIVCFFPILSQWAYSCCPCKQKSPTLVVRQMNPVCLDFGKIIHHKSYMLYHKS